MASASAFETLSSGLRAIAAPSQQDSDLSFARRKVCAAHGKVHATSRGLHNSLKQYSMHEGNGRGVGRQKGGHPGQKQGLYYKADVLSPPHCRHRPQCLFHAGVVVIGGGSVLMKGCSRLRVPPSLQIQISRRRRQKGLQNLLWMLWLHQPCQTMLQCLGPADHRHESSLLNSDVRQTGQQVELDQTAPT